MTPSSSRARARRGSRRCTCSRATGRSTRCSTGSPPTSRSDSSRAGGRACFPGPSGCRATRCGLPSGWRSARRAGSRVGSVNGRRFAFNAGIGFDAELVRRVDALGRRSDGKRPGDLAFALHGRADARRPPVSLRAGARDRRSRAGGVRLRRQLLAVHLSRPARAPARAGRCLRRRARHRRAGRASRPLAAGARDPGLARTHAAQRDALPARRGPAP